MRTEKKRAPKFRVGDWVSLLYGARMILAQVVEDRGRIGYRGRHLYGLHLDVGADEPTYLEWGDEDLEAATDAEKEAWRIKRSIALHQTLTYHGNGPEKDGVPQPWYPYLIVARPGTETGSGQAAIIYLLARVPPGVAQDLFPKIFVKAGGAEAALDEAEQHLDSRHPGLKKIVGPKYA